MSSVAVRACSYGDRCAANLTSMRILRRFACVWLLALLGGCPQPPGPDVPDPPSMARQWDEAMLAAIRLDTGRPTVAARTLFHTSVAMYDAWAGYDAVAAGYLVQEKAVAPDVEAAREEAISFAAYRVLSERFASSPNASQIQAQFDGLMDTLGYDRSNTTATGDSPAAAGNRVAAAVISFGHSDGSNEANNYADTTGYMPVNPPLEITASGTSLTDPNRWQPLTIHGVTQTFVTPQWGQVTPFALQRASATQPHLDPGTPPQLGGPGDPAYKAQAQRSIRYSSWLDASDGVVIDISPGVQGNNTLGADDGLGHGVNPATGQAYASNLVLRGDWARVVAEYWADGRGTVTPPGHWNVIANEISSRLARKQIGGSGPVVSDLEWDVKMYLALNGAVHDAGIAAWDIKRFYDYARPTGIIRFLGQNGQSSDPWGESYSVQGLPLVPGLIELITPQTTAAGGPHEGLAGHEGQIAIHAWRGWPSQQGEAAGVGWILAADWVPYQAHEFVTPSFPGYISGHSAFSRASAEVLTWFTGSEFFPGGLAEFTAPAGTFLQFESGPLQDVTLQWATYYDASDEAGRSRILGGIHVTPDDYMGRAVGSAAGKAAYSLAQQYFQGHVVQPPVTAAASVAVR